jgi:hypothetical protein
MRVERGPPRGSNLTGPREGAFLRRPEAGKTLADAPLWERMQTAGRGAARALGESAEKLRRKKAGLDPPVHLAYSTASGTVATHLGCGCRGIWVFSVGDRGSGGGFFWAVFGEAENGNKIWLLYYAGDRPNGPWATTWVRGISHAK